MRCLRVALFLMSSLLAVSALAQQFDPALYAGMRWRLIGPFRGGRSVAVAGVPSQPNVFYFGGVAGGVWKTENAGETWVPIFDSQPIASIGAVAVAASNPNVIYVGSGEADMRSDISHGDGLYKSTDGGKTWRHVGLSDTRQIGRILVDPRNPDMVFVAALGHGYGPNAERGVFRSTDGGNTWQKVLYKDENTGAIDLAWNADNPKTIYASLWRTRRTPWNVYPPSNGPGSGLYKSADGGNTWQHIVGKGFPEEGVGRIGIAVAPGNAKRIYAIVDAKEGGLYRSDDAGGTWQRMSSEARIWGRGWYFGQVETDPKDADTVYVMNTSTYRSRDGGKTFEAIKGAPGGDDYHQLWINPNDATRMVMATDQGVIVSVDGARSWTTWYNQPTAQIYHVATDNAFPYRIYGAQQDSGAVAVPSRTNWAQGISFRDWYPACAGGESGYVAPDPLDANILYGGTVTRCNQSVNADKNVSPTVNLPGPFRTTWTLPLVFSEKDPHALYFSHQVLFKTTDGGQRWEQISPDLTRENPGTPSNLDEVTAKNVSVKGPRRGVIYTIAPSPLEADRIWVGTDDGLIHLTVDGGRNWRDVTPPEVTPWSKIGIVEASHFDAETAYAAVDRHRLEDLRPYIFRTHDGGRTWKKITDGLPANVYVNAVREDPKRKGLLFAGTETAVFVSFNDGDHWQPLQLNLPHTSMRDFAIHGDDLIVATHGRSIWVLDDITPLRQFTAEVAGAAAHLFQPAPAIRMQGSPFDGTPLPLGSPVGENPPNGAMLDYYLKQAATTPVALEIYDGNNALVRRYSSAEKPRPVDPTNANIPAAWLKAPQVLDQSAGMHRFVWDLHWSAPAAGEGRRGGGGGGRGAGAGQWALPGQYTVKLTVAGQTYSQPLSVTMDPRVKTPAADLEKQFAAARRAGQMLLRVSEARRTAGRLQQQLQAVRAKAAGRASASTALETFERKLTALIGAATGGGIAGPPEEDSVETNTLSYVARMISGAEGSIESAPEAPTSGDIAALDQAERALGSLMTTWEQIRTADLAKLNSVLRENGLPPIE